jgi:hypothetical protein
MGYFVFANAGKNRDKFDGKLEFELTVIPYKGNDNWVRSIVKKIKECLDKDQVPPPNNNCEYCGYLQKRWKIYKDDVAK